MVLLHDITTLAIRTMLTIIFRYKKKSEPTRDQISVIASSLLEVMLPKWRILKYHRKSYLKWNITSKSVNKLVTHHFADEAATIFFMLFFVNECIFVHPSLKWAEHATKGACGDSSGDKHRQILTANFISSYCPRPGSSFTLLVVNLSLS